MGLIDRVRGFFAGPRAEQLAASTATAPLPSPNAPPFVRGRTRRGGQGLFALGPGRGAVERYHLDRLASWVSQEVDTNCDPLSLPLASLRRMDGDPIVYLAEQAITGLPRRPDLYHVKSPVGNKRHEAEVEEWLWPLLPKLLAQISRAFVYGVAPYVLDVGREDLVIVVPDKNGKPRQQTLEDYVQFFRSHELWPGHVTIETDRSNELVRVNDEETGRSYGAGVSRVSVWDKQYGEWRGQAARRRAWSPFAKGRIFELLQARYLEKTIHTPLVVYGKGQSIPVSEDDPDDLMPMDEYVQEELANLYGGGSLNLPADRDDNGERVWEVEPLELPENSEVWDRALNRFDGHKFAAYLVPPGMSGVEDSLAGGSARVVKDLFSVFVEGFVDFIACELNGIVSTVHALNNTGRNGKLTAPAPEILASPIPDKKAKQFLEVFRTVAQASSISESVDGPELLKTLGVPVRVGGPQGGEGGSQSPGQRGRPRDTTSAREERREDSRTDEAGDDTGASEGGGRGDE